MRNLKRALCLTLASVMLLGMMVVGTSALSYGDVDSNDNVEAIDLLQAISVMSGDDKGNFNPDQVVTRAEMAVIVCNILYGKNLNVGQFVGTDVFNDVPLWAQGYVNLAASLGIVAGVGDGKFAPNEPVTTAQAALMICRALGYFQTDAEFAKGWMLAATERGTKIGLYKDLTGLSATAGLTRNDVAQMVFNALTEATPVTYNEIFGYYTVGGTLTSGVLDGEDAFNLTLAYKTFDVSSKPDFQFGQDGYIWINRISGKELTGFYSDDVTLATSMDGTVISKLTSKSSDKYVAELDTTVTTTPVYNGPSFYYNGAAIAAFDATKTYSGGELVVYGNSVYVMKSHSAGAWSSSDATEFSKKGAIVIFVDVEENDNTYDGKAEKVLIVDKTVAELAGDPVVQTSGSVSEVTVPGITGLSEIDVTRVKGYEGLKEEDIVLWYSMVLDGKTYYYIEKAETVTGTLTAYNTTSNKATIDGTVYNMSGLTGSDVASIDDDTKTRANTTFYLDNGGNIVAYKLDSATVSLDNTLFVISAKEAGYTYQAKVVFMDGTTGTITVAKTAKYDGSLKDVIGTSGPMADGKLVANTFYTYTENAGSYNLTSCQYQGATAESADDGSAAVVTKGNATITLSDASKKLANSSTAYILQKGSVDSTFTAGTTYAAYTGVANTAGYKDGKTSDSEKAVAYVLYNSKGYATAVVGINGVQDTSSAVDYTVVYALSGPTTNYVSGGSDFYTYKAIVNGEVVDAYAAKTQLFTKGQANYVDSFDGDKAASVVSGGDAARIVKTDSIKGINMKDNTLSLYTDADKTTLSKAVVLNSNVQMFVFDTRDNADTVTKVATLNGLAGTTYSVTTVQTSSTDTSISYVFVEITG